MPFLLYMHCSIIHQDQLRNINIPTPDHLIIQYANPSKHSGNYSCSAENRLGTDTAMVHVTVAGRDDVDFFVSALTHCLELIEEFQYFFLGQEIHARDTMQLNHIFSTKISFV